MSINQSVIPWSCESQFFLREPSSPPQGGVAAPPEKPKTGKLLLFSDFHKHLSGPHVLVCLISLVSSPSCYPVAPFSAPIRRTMLLGVRRNVRRQHHRPNPGKALWLGGLKEDCTKRLRSILGNIGAAITLALAALTPFLLYGWFQNVIGAAHLRIDPTYSGGEVSHVIERADYRIVVNRPVPRRSPLQRVDLDGDGVPDVRVAIESRNLVVDVAPLGARYRPMHSRGVTSFSALVARVKDALVVRIPLI